MGKVTVVLDRTQQGYTAYMSDLPGAFTVGDNLEEIRANLTEVIELYKVGKTEDGEPIEEFLSEPVEFEYKMDMESFSNFYGILKQSTIAHLAGINSSLLRQYARGIKKPSEKQVRKIEKAIHQLGRELLQVRF